MDDANRVDIRLALATVLLTQEAEALGDYTDNEELLESTLVDAPVKCRMKSLYHAAATYCKAYDDYAKTMPPDWIGHASTNNAV
jgi:hypothetical protein